MRKKFELGSGIALILIAVAGIPADWKITLVTLVGGVLIVAGLVELRREQKKHKQAHVAFVDGGPVALTKEETTIST